ncbi:nickel-dependent hydrogenase large subunit [Candidatus Woesearchaeota archaeon]|nr:nickel-dependent hydrogenase large subunit [Candidatus Woesearchaeota archaeon]
MHDAYKMFLGPAHPALEEPIMFDFKIEGEKVVDVVLKPGHAHRGIEYVGMKRNPVQVVHLAERVCGICSISHASTFCRAVESAAGITVPERADYIRTIVCELERIHSHTLWAGLLAHEIGFHSVLHYGMKVRENVMDLLEYIGGNRVNYGMYMIGGVRRDIPDAKKERVLNAVKYYKEAYAKFCDVFLKDTTIKLRTENVGVLTKKDALELCTVGPTARGSGVMRDIRQDWAYVAYGDIGVKAQSPQEIRGKIVGDALDRTIVRLLEIKQSAEIIEQCMDRMPKGELTAFPKVAMILPRLAQVQAEAVSRQEAPRGELHHYVRLDRRPEVDTWKVKAPTYSNLLSLKPMMKDMQIADIPVVVASIDPCIACLDRVAIVEDKGLRGGTGTVGRTMSKYDLHELCLRKSKSLGRIEEHHIHHHIHQHNKHNHD